MRHWLSRIGITLTLMTALAMGAAALTPQQLDTAIAAVSAEYPEAVVVEVHVESNWDNPLISMQLDNGWEVYVASTTGEIIDRTRNHTRRDDRRLARQIRDGDIRSIPEAYRSILDQLAATGPVANSDGATLYDLGFDREYGRLMVNASFRPAVQAVAARLLRHADPRRRSPRPRPV